MRAYSNKQEYGHFHDFQKLHIDLLDLKYSVKMLLQ